MIADHRARLEDSSNVRLEPVAPRGSSPALVHVPSTRRVLDLQDPAGPVVPLADDLDLAPDPDLALHAPAALAHDRVPAALLRPVRRRARNAHHRIAPAAVASSIQRPRKAQ